MPSSIDELELRGVSVLFLATIFAQSLKQKLGTLYGHGCASFCNKDAEDCPQRQEFSGETMGDARPYDFDQPELREAGKDLICPRDGEKGCAYVDYLATLKEGFVGHANVMISYTWGYSILAIGSALMAWCDQEGRDPRTTYVWICCMCINQHRVAGTTVSTEFLANVFKKRGQRIGNLVSLLAPFAKPVNLTRSW